MSKKINWADRLIYQITKKPECYKEVRNPPKTTKDKLLRPQDARQMQYNKWSKKYQVYSGSYLPYSVDELTKNGWKKQDIPRNQAVFNEEYILFKSS